MLTHQIKFKKTKVAQAFSDSDDNDLGNWPYVGDNRKNHHGILNGGFKRFDKLGYAQYLNRLPMKVGDFLVWHDCADLPFDHLEIYRFNVVEGFQEVHLQADYSDHFIPRCVAVRALTAQPNPTYSTYYSRPDNWYVIPPDKVPQFVKDTYANMVNQSQKN